MLQNVKKALANSEPSTHGTFRTSRDVRVMSAFSGNSEVAISSPDFRFDPSPTSSAQPKVFHPFI